MLILERDLDLFSSPVGSELEAKFGCGTHCFGQSQASRERVMSASARCECIRILPLNPFAPNCPIGQSDRTVGSKLFGVNEP